MKVLFVAPPVDYPIVNVNIGSELGILNLVAQVKKYCKVQIDFYSFEYAKLVPPRYTIEELFSIYQPNVICVSVLTHSYPFAKQISKAAKERGCVVIWGGIFVSQKGSEILNDSNCVDYYITGEGELSLPKLINEISLKTDSLRCNKPVNKIFQPESYDSFHNCALPDYSIIPSELISKHNLRATLETARGCKFSCEFCSLNNLSYKQKDKGMSRIESELINISALGFRKVLICDNNFLLERETLTKFYNCKQKIAPDIKLRITIRLDLIDLPLLKQFRRIGVDEIIIGIEHVDDNILSSMKKTAFNGTSWQKMAEEKITLAADMGFLVHPIFMFGWPEETPFSIEKNKIVACKLGSHVNVEPFVAFITPHPGNNVESFISQARIKRITSDYSKYIHLYPVAVPISFDKRNIIQLIEAHNEIRTTSNMTYRNPCISSEFVFSYSDLIN